MWPYSKAKTIALLAPLAFLFAFSLDLYIPIIPELQASLQTTKQIMNLTCTLFMLFCGIGQIVAGPLTDLFGRRKIILISLITLIISNLICIYATNISLLILGRSLQAIACCGTYLSAFASIRDIYKTGSESASMYSYLNVSIALSPLFAPSLGAYLAYFFGWQSTFISLNIIACISLAMVWYTYKETAPLNFTIDKTQELIQNYKRVLQHPNYQVYTFVSGVGMGSFFAFYTVYPYIIQQGLQISKQSSGYGYGMVGLAYLIGSFVSGKICARLSVFASVLLGITIAMIGAVSMLLAYTLFGLSFYGFIIPMMIVVFGAAFMLGAGMGGTMEPFGDIAGTAFAAIGCYKFLFCAALGSFIMHWQTTPLPLAIIMCILNITSAILCFTYKYKIAIVNNKLEDNIIQTI